MINYVNVCKIVIDERELCEFIISRSILYVTKKEKADMQPNMSALIQETPETTTILRSRGCFIRSGRAQPFSMTG